MIVHSRQIAAKNFETGLAQAGRFVVFKPTNGSGGRSESESNVK
jgi:hypothetical protein